MLANLNNANLREQMRAVALYVRTSTAFGSIYPELLELSPKDMVASALAAGDCESIRAALRKKNVDVRVKSVLRSMEIATRGVEGSESERNILRYKFGALRVWSGCSLLFFTLNPHDIHTPLLVYFIGDREEQLEKARRGARTQFPFRFISR